MKIIELLPKNKILKLNFTTESTITISVLVIIVLSCNATIVKKKSAYNAIYSGIPWFDDRGYVISAHGAGILKDNGRYYLFGEFKTDTSNTFNGFSCYSSKDLYNWTFEKIVLPV